MLLTIISLFWISLPCFAEDSKYVVLEIPSIKNYSHCYCVVNQTSKDTVYKFEESMTFVNYSIIDNYLYELSGDSFGKSNLVFKKIKLSDSTSYLVKELEINHSSGSKVLVDFKSMPMRISLVTLELVMTKVKNEWSSSTEIKATRYIEIDPNNLKIIRNDLIKNPYFYTNDNK